MLFALDLLIFVTVAVTIYLLARSPGDSVIRRRALNLRQSAGRLGRLEEKELELPFRQRVLEPALRRLAQQILKGTPAALRERLKNRLAQAGRPMDVSLFLSYEFLIGLTLFLLYFLLSLDHRPSQPVSFSGRLLGATVLALTGSLLPEIWLLRLVNARKKAMERSLPDVLDLLTVSVEAGLGFDGAVQKVSEKFTGPVGEEFAAFLKEVRFGLARSEALRHMTRRIDHPDVRIFVASVIQADQLGVSLAKVLRVQADQLRFRRKQRAEEKAMQIPIKLLFPLTIFIFPTIFIVLLGPVLIQYLGMFKK
ncbi:MAG: type II secretion system F family protein [Firmicutes bacterium]|nr:type II secretion system F family protein [Bacillota bacterium]MCL5038834.1 type II secretion system F family protein [Bacillota bacterium]